MEMKLEVVMLGVSDVDASRRFYESLGFVLDVDVEAGPEMRVVQLTPPGSACSIVFGEGIQTPDPGAVRRLHLVVADLPAAIEALRDSEAKLTKPFHFGPGGQDSGLDPDRRDYGSYSSFSDPDGNLWLLQEVSGR